MDEYRHDPAGPAGDVTGRSWYDRRGEGLGGRLLDEIRSSLTAILEFPVAFPLIDAIYRRKLLEVFPFALIYRLDEDTITIVAVANFKRRPGYWRRRDKSPGP